MPKLIINRRKAPPTPPCGRKIEFVTPFSPFQKLVDQAIKSMPSEKFPDRMMSYHECAAKIGVHKASFWAWLHSKNGCPHPNSLKPEILKNISDFLKIPLPRLQESIDASRHLYTKRETPAPTASLDAFKGLIRILENDKRTTLTRSYVLNLAKRLYAGAKASS